MLEFTDVHVKEKLPAFVNISVLCRRTFYNKEPHKFEEENKKINIENKYVNVSQ